MRAVTVYQNPSPEEVGVAWWRARKAVKLAAEIKTVKVQCFEKAEAKKELVTSFRGLTIVVLVRVAKVSGCGMIQDGN